MCRICVERQTEGTEPIEVQILPLPAKSARIDAVFGTPSDDNRERQLKPVCEVKMPDDDGLVTICW
jgi:hypothetical protein